MLGAGNAWHRLPHRPGVAQKLFIIAIIIGELPCLLTGFAQNYAAFLAPGADRHRHKRGHSGVFLRRRLLFPTAGLSPRYLGLAEGLGIAIGQLIAGFIGPEYGWRLPFIIIALPNFVLVVVYWLTIKEPPRGIAEVSLKHLIEDGKVYTGKINWASYRDLFKIKTNIMVFLQGIPGTVPWGVFFIFLNDFYSQDKGFSVEVATLIVMMVGAAAIIGGFAGGVIGNWLYNIKPKYPDAVRHLNAYRHNPDGDAAELSFSDRRAESKRGVSARNRIYHRFHCNDHRPEHKSDTAERQFTGNARVDILTL